MTALDDIEASDDWQEEYPIGNGSGCRANAEGGASSQLRGRNQKIARRVTEKRFQRVSNVAFHKLATDGMSPLAMRAFFVLSRDAGYGGYCYTTPAVIAKDLRAHVVALRKALQELERCGWVIRLRTKNSGTKFLLNPNLVFAGSVDDEEIAKSIWARERQKLLAAC